jgi:hypothetical protein
MAVTFDSVGGGVATTRKVTSASWQHVMGVSATALIVAVNFSGSSNVNNSLTRTVKVGTKTLTPLGSIINRYNLFFAPVGWIELFGIIGPPTGVQSIFVTCSASEEITANSVTYNGASAFGTFAGGIDLIGTSQTLPPVTGPTKGMVVGAFGVTSNRTLTAGSGQTMRWTASSNSSVGIEDTTATGSVSMSMNVTGLISASWGGVAVALVPATVASIGHTTATTPLAPKVTLTAAVTASLRGAASRTITATTTASATAVSPIGPKTAAALVRTVTATPTASAFSFTPPPPNAAALPVTVARTADATLTLAPTTAATSPLRYVGRYPDEPDSVVSKRYATSLNSTTALTTSFIDQIIGSRAQFLATTAFVDQEDIKRATRAEVTAADTNYFPATGHGLAVTDSTGKLPASAVPASGLVTDRTARYYACAAPSISTPTRVVTATPTELLIGTVTVTDQGYPWIPLVFAYVKGYDRIGVSPTRWAGTGVADAAGRILVNNVGILTVQGSNGTVYGSGRCTASIRDTYSVVLPAATSATNAASVSGALTLNLYGSCRDGAGRDGEGYTFTGSDLIFYVIAMPAG